MGSEMCIRDREYCCCRSFNDRGKRVVVGLGWLGFSYLYLLSAFGETKYHRMSKLDIVTAPFRQKLRVTINQIVMSIGRLLEEIWQGEEY